MRKRTVRDYDASERQAVIYARVSTVDQARSGLGIEDQVAACRAHCLAQGWEVRAVFVDAGVSAKDLDRPELQAALRALEAGDVLVALKLDRVTRTTADFPELTRRIEAADAALVLVRDGFDTSSAMGRAILSFALTLSQLERELTGERTAAALQQKKVRGERLGATPTGYRTVDGALVEDPEEMRLVRRARELNDGRSLRAIGEQLRAEGFKAKRGGAFGPSAVKRLLEVRYVERLAE